MLFRLYFWSHPPMMLLYIKVGFIPAEIIDTFHWPLLFVMDHCPRWDAQVHRDHLLLVIHHWIVVSALHVSVRSRTPR